MFIIIVYIVNITMASQIIVIASHIIVNHIIISHTIIIIVVHNFF
jgi:hypothetical protein